MKNIVFLLLAILISGCGGQQKKETSKAEMASEVAETTTPVQETMLIGKKDRNDLKQAPYNSWYDSNYNDYKPDEAVVEKLKPLVTGLEITIVAGTWCRDSKKQVPALYKVIDAIGIPEESITFIGVDRDKTTPQELEEGLDITNTPTIIFMKKGKEMNRIVEFPIETLEDDMYQILSGQEYKHAYAW